MTRSAPGPSRRGGKRFVHPVSFRIGAKQVGCRIEIRKFASHSSKPEQRSGNTLIVVLGQRRALAALDELEHAGGVRLRATMIEPQRFDEVLAEPDVDEIRLVEHHLEREVIDQSVGPVEEHRGPETENVESQGFEQGPERSVELETPAAAAPVDNLWYGPGEVGADLDAVDHVDVLERNRRQVCMLQLPQRVQRRFDRARIPDAVEIALYGNFELGHEATLAKAVGPSTIRSVDNTKTFEDLIGLALTEATVALEHHDVPVGALVIGPNGDVLASRHNERELTGDPTAHAEILALRDAAEALGSWRLDDHTLVVTLEPCVMCAGAAQQSRIGRVVYGAMDPKAGALGSLYNIGADPRFPHDYEVVMRVRESDCAKPLIHFFADKR